MLTLAVLLQVACSRSETIGLRFAVIGDSRGSKAVFPAIIDSLNRISPALVVHLGDLIHGYTDDLAIIKKQWRLVDRQLSGLGVPFFVTPGNHDTYAGKAHADPRLVAFLHQRFGQWPFCLEHSGALFLFLNSSRPGEEQEIGPTQLEWLDREIRRWGADRGPAFLFVHHPLSSPSGRSIVNADQVLEILKGSAVKTIFCSHDHMYHRAVLPSGSLQFITGGGGASLRGLPPERGGFFHFLTVLVDRNYHVTVNVHHLDGIVEPAQSWPPVEYGS
jgi:3',5'-cyclic AMP phosphodiesterase CpdA